MGAEPVAGRPPVGQSLRVIDDELRLELLARAQDASAVGNADRLWDLLDELEAWPGYALVGPDGEAAAWLLAQLGDAELQRRCLGHLEIAVDLGDADPAHYACLLDRVRMGIGQPQVYGSQFVDAPDDDLAPWPISAPDSVDDRRRRVGLPPLDAQHASMRDARQRAKSTARQQYQASTDR